MNEQPNKPRYAFTSYTPFYPTCSWWTDCDSREQFSELAAVEFERMRYSRFGRGASSGLSEGPQGVGLAEREHLKKHQGAI